MTKINKNVTKSVTKCHVLVCNIAVSCFIAKLLQKCAHDENKQKFELNKVLKNNTFVIVSSKKMDFMTFTPLDDPLSSSMNGLRQICAKRCIFFLRFFFN